MQARLLSGDFGNRTRSLIHFSRWSRSPSTPMVDLHAHGTVPNAHPHFRVLFLNWETFDWCTDVNRLEPLTIPLEAESSLLTLGRLFSLLFDLMDDNSTSQKWTTNIAERSTRVQQGSVMHRLEEEEKTKTQNDDDVELTCLTKTNAHLESLKYDWD